MAEASVPGKRQDSLKEQVAIQVTKKTIEYLLSIVREANGIPKAPFEPFAKLYTDYGKKFIELYFAAKEMEPFWRDCRSLTDQATYYLGEIDIIIKRTPVPEVSPGAALFIIGPWVNNQQAMQIRRDQEQFMLYLRRVVEILDNLIAGAEDIIAGIASMLGKLDEKLDVRRAGNLFKTVLVPGSLGSERTGICIVGQDALVRYRKLIEHRNDWAKLARIADKDSAGTSTIKKKKEFFETCSRNP
ncbi:MAG: hypothetical protein HY537_01795 [Deltaproteobacteria bacterium]|nr:hypothetical protein [Deltaproteobacteria bacterium]